MGERAGQQTRSIAQACTPPVFALLVLRSEAGSAAWRSRARDRLFEDSRKAGRIAICVEVPSEISREGVAEVLAALSNDCAGLEIFGDVEFSAQYFAGARDVEGALKTYRGLPISRE